MATIKKIITGGVLCECDVYTLNGIFPLKDRIIIEGTVYFDDKNIVSNVGIIISQFDTSYEPPKFLYKSVTFSDEFGKYGISVPWSKNSTYVLKVYSP